MRYLIITATLLVFVSALPVQAVDCGKSWRVGATYSTLTSTETQDVFGNAWGGGFEYSFSKSLSPDEAIPGDISVALYFRRFDNTRNGVDRAINYGSFGLKWRGGAGANPGSDGLYGGVEAAAALLDIRPSVESSASHEGVTKFEWSIFGGANFARM